MKKLKKYQKLIFIIGFILINIFLFNILTFKTIIYIPKNLNLDYQKAILTKNDFDISKSKEIRDTNDRDLAEYDYIFTIKNIPKNIKSLSLDYLKLTGTTSSSVVKVYYQDGKDKTYKNKIIDNTKQSIFLLNETNIKKIEVNVEVYKYSDQLSEVILLKSISLNCHDKLIKKTIITNLIKTILITTFFLLVFLYSIRKKEKLKKDKLFIVLYIGLIGIASAILIPTYQVVDEHTHLNLIYEDELKLGKTFDEYNDYHPDYEKIIRNYNEKIDYQEYLNFDDKLKPIKLTTLPSIKVIKHLPQSICLIILSYLHLPILIGLLLTELFALAFYAFILLKAIKIIPIKKEILLFVGLFPICIQQMASFNYDVVFLSMGYLYIAYLLKLKFQKEELQIRQLIYLFIMLIIIGICKIPYMILGLLIFLLDPVKKIIKDNKKKIPLMIILVILLMALGIYLFRDNICVKLLIATFYNFSNSSRVILTTCSHFFNYYMHLCGYLGWFDVPIVLPFYFLFIIFMVYLPFASKNNNLYFSLKEKLYIIGVVLLMTFLVIISMYWYTVEGLYDISILDYSMQEIASYYNQIDSIAGLQGRYFIFGVLLILLLINDKKFPNQEKITYLFSKFYYIILFIYIVTILLKRYWLF